MENIETQEEYKKSKFPKWLQYSLISILCIILILFLLVTLYRYFLVAKAINVGEYTTALALASPEVGSGIGFATRSLF